MILDITEETFDDEQRIDEDTNTHEEATNVDRGSDTVSTEHLADKSSANPDTDIPA